MNQYRQALKYIAIIALVLGAIIVIIAASILANDLNRGVYAAQDPGAVIWRGLGEGLFSLGLLGLFFWLLAESIAHGQRALIQTMERLAAPEVQPSDSSEPVVE